MGSYDTFRKQLLENPEVKKEYDALQAEYDIIKALIEAKKQRGLTQKDLSHITEITQADISRIENRTRNPSLAMLKRLADGMRMRLKLEFIRECKINCVSQERES